MAGTPEELNSPYGNRPSTLPNPVAGEGMENEVEQANAQAGAGLEPSVGPEGQVATQTPMTSPDMPQEVPPQGQGAPQSAEELLASWDQEPEFDSAAPSTFMEQIREAPMRLRNAFAVTDKESEQVIKESGLFDDAKIKDGEWYVKRRGQEKFTKLDKDGIQLITDTLDFARDGIEILVEAGTEVAGTAAGIVGTAPAGGVGGFTANVAAGAAGAVGAKNVGDYIAQEWMGIEQDPERSMVSENAMAGAFGAGFGWLGSTMARRSAQRLARKQTQKASEKSLENTMETVNETMEDIELVRNSGIKLDDDFRVDPNMATGGGDPELRSSAKWLSTEEGYRNFVDEMGSKLTGAYDSLTKQVGRFAGKNTDNIGKDFVLTSDDIIKAEGKLIGDFSQAADKASRSRAQAAPRTYQILDAFRAELGDINGKISVDGIIDNIGVQSEKARMLVAKINKVKQASPKGQMSVNTTKAIYDDLTRTINKMSPADRAGPNGRALIELKNAVRDDWVDMVEAIVPKSQKGQFTAARSRYKQLMDANRSLGTLLQNESISRDVLTRKLFEGQKSYELMTSAKTIIQETNPELWQDMAVEYFKGLKRLGTDEIVEKGADGIERSVRTVNWNSMAKRWKKLDPRVQQELAETSGFGKQGIDALFNLGKKYQKADVGFMAKESQQGFIKRNLKALIGAYLGGGAATATGVVTMLEGIGKDGALMKWLQDGNMEQIISEFKGIKKRGHMRKGLDELSDLVYKWKPNAPMLQSTARKAPGVVLRREAEEE